MHALHTSLTGNSTLQTELFQGEFKIPTLESTMDIKSRKVQVLHLRDALVKVMRQQSLLLTFPHSCGYWTVTPCSWSLFRKREAGCQPVCLCSCLTDPPSSPPLPSALQNPPVNLRARLNHQGGEYSLSKLVDKKCQSIECLLSKVTRLCLICTWR